MKFLLFIPLLSVISFNAQSATDKDKKALNFVPGGEIQSSGKDEIKVKTTAGTIVEVELDRDGSLDEASGEFALKDSFVPGKGLLSLNKAVEAMKKHGKTVEGEWSLEKDFLRDWEYEFEGVENNKKYEYALNAKTGELIKSEAD